MKKNSIPRRRTNPVLASMNQMQRDNILIRATQKANLLVTCVVLADKFDFSTEQLKEYMVEFRKQLDAYNEGYIERVSDFEEILSEEHDIKIEL
jgi:hypothetical protein